MIQSRLRASRISAACSRLPCNSPADTKHQPHKQVNTPQNETLTAVGIPRWRTNLLAVLQILGTLLGLLGSADLMGILNTLKPEAAAWLAVSGAGLRFAAEPIMILIGDWADDGILNKSYKIVPLLVFLLVLSFLCSSCSMSVGNAAAFRVAPIDKYMCGLVEYKASNGQTYSAGACTGNMYVVVYEDPVTKVRGAYLRNSKTGVSTLYYQASDGSWLRYSSKSGIDLGPPPVTEVTPVPATRSTPNTLVL